jgi:outer membrane cobalamin receptor
VYGRKPYAEVIPAQTLAGKKLEGLNSHSIADAIRYFSGVQVKDYGGVGGIKTIDIRSMGTNHLGVFYDGIQLGNAQNGQIDLGKFSLDNIEEISLYNGQKSEIFQPARDFGSAGTVYIRTRRPKFMGNKNDNFNVTMRTGSFGLANPSVRWEHRFNRNLTMSLNAEYTYATGQYHFRYRKVFSDGVVAWDTTAVRKNGDISSLRLEGAIFGAITDGKWNVKAYYYDSERGIPGAIINNVWQNSQRQWDRNLFVQGSWQKRIT